MAPKINILGTVDMDAYHGIESVYTIIEELAITGINAICFSIHNESESHLSSFSLSDWKCIKQYCEALNIEFIGRPHTMAAVDYFEQLNVRHYRLAAEEICNFPLLEKVARTRKEIIISAPAGMDWQLERIVDFIQPYENNLIMMQWMPTCPCDPNEWGLTRLEWLKDHFGYKVGLCDRSGDIFASTAAIALGAEYVEFRINDYSKDLRKKLIAGIRNVETSLRFNHDFDDYSLHLTHKGLYERSLVINKDKKKGSIIVLEDIEIINNCNGIDISRYDDIVGKYLCKNIRKGELLDWEILQTNAEF